MVIEALSKRLARTLSIKFEDVDTHQALHAYGVDSLIAVEFRTWLGKEFAAGRACLRDCERKDGRSCWGAGSQDEWDRNERVGTPGKLNRFEHGSQF